jgi:hypothetical protein
MFIISIAHAMPGSASGNIEFDDNQIPISTLDALSHPRVVSIIIIFALLCWCLHTFDLFREWGPLAYYFCILVTLFVVWGVERLLF